MVIGIDTYYELMPGWFQIIPEKKFVKSSNSSLIVQSYSNEDKYRGGRIYKIPQYVYCYNRKGEITKTIKHNIKVGDYILFEYSEDTVNFIEKINIRTTSNNHKTSYIIPFGSIMAIINKKTI